MATPKSTAGTSVFTRALPFILIICSGVALACSFILSQDELQIVKNPAFVPSCNLNPVLSCGSVIRTHQASVFGFPNPWLGLVSFGVFLAIGVMLLAGATLQRWFWLAFETGLGLAMVFAYWLLFQSIYNIGALCPYCLVVDIVLTTMFWYVTLHVFENRHLKLPGKLQSAVAFSRKHHAEILVTWFLIFIALILQHFWYYYGQFL